ncbi:MAG: c-type cytochrome [Pseudomonadota bacterium]
MINDPRRHPWRSAVFGAALFAVACGPVQGEPEEPPAASSEFDQELLGVGEAIAEQMCSGCHAVGTEGESPHVEAVPFRRFSWRYPIRDLAEPLERGIVVGHPDMPVFQFEPGQVEALLKYIESVQEPQRT